MAPMDSRARRRRGRRALLLATVVVVGGSALLGYALRSPENVHRGTVSYFAPTQDAASDPEVVKSLAANSTIAWAGWGFDAAHHRQNPQAQQRPPFTQLWGAGLDSLAEFPPVADDKGVYIETARGGVVALNPRTGKRRWTRRVAPLSRPALHSTSAGSMSPHWAASCLPCAAATASACGATRCTRARSPRPCSSTARSTSAPRTARSPRSTPGPGTGAGACTSAEPSRAHPPIAAGCWWSAPTTATSTDSTRARARAAGAPPGSARYGGLQQGHFYSTPTIAYGRVYIGSTDGRVYSLVASTGKIAWTAQTGGYVYAGPAVVHQLVLIGSYDRKFYAFNARTGARRWRFDAKARISGSASVVNDIVYFSTFGNGTFGLAVRNGRRVWRRYEGRYSPVVATRNAFYFVGYSTLRRLRPRTHPPVSSCAPTAASSHVAAMQSAGVPDALPRQLLPRRGKPAEEHLAERLAHAAASPHDIALAHQHLVPPGVEQRGHLHGRNRAAHQALAALEPEFPGRQREQAPRAVVDAPPATALELDLAALQRARKRLARLGIETIERASECLFTGRHESMLPRGTPRRRMQPWQRHACSR